MTDRETRRQARLERKRQAIAEGFLVCRRATIRLLDARRQSRRTPLSRVLAAFVVDVVFKRYWWPRALKHHPELVEYERSRELGIRDGRLGCVRMEMAHREKLKRERRESIELEAFGRAPRASVDSQWLSTVVPSLGARVLDLTHDAVDGCPMVHCYVFHQGGVARPDAIPLSEFLATFKPVPRA